MYVTVVSMRMMMTIERLVDGGLRVLEFSVRSLHDKAGYLL